MRPAIDEFLARFSFLSTGECYRLLAVLTFSSAHKSLRVLRQHFSRYHGHNGQMTVTRIPTMSTTSGPTKLERSFLPQTATNQAHTKSQPSSDTNEVSKQDLIGNSAGLISKTSPSDNRFTAQLPATTGFLSLPRELRQKIFQNAFREAAIDDNTFCGLLKYSHLGLTNAETRLIVLNVKSYISRLERGIILRGNYAPHIHALASKLVEVHPSVSDDLAYVVDKALDYLQNIQKEERAEIAQERSQNTGADRNRSKRGRFAGSSRLTNIGTRNDDATFVHLFPNWRPPKGEFEWGFQEIHV